MRFAILGIFHLVLASTPGWQCGELVNPPTSWVEFRTSRNLYSTADSLRGTLRNLRSETIRLLWCERRLSDVLEVYDHSRWVRYMESPNHCSEPFEDVESRSVISLSWNLSGIVSPGLFRLRTRYLLSTGREYDVVSNQFQIIR